VAVEDDAACAGDPLGAGTGVGSGQCELTGQHVPAAPELFLAICVPVTNSSKHAKAPHLRRCPWVMNCSIDEQSQLPAAYGPVYAWCLRGGESVNQNGSCPSVHLSIDHGTQLEIAVNLRDATVELRCPGLEMKMQEYVLGRLIEICEQAQVEIEATPDSALCGQAVATRVECDRETPLTWSKAGDLVELMCGTVIIQVTGPALAALIRGARIAYSGLRQHLASAKGDAGNTPQSHQ